jgi:hypothetical protein
MGLNTSRIGVFIGPNPNQLDNLKSILEPELANWLASEAKHGFRRQKG